MERFAALVCLVVPLTPGATAGVEGLPAVTVRSVAADRAALGSRYTEWVLPYRGWFVIDEQGNAYPATYSATGWKGVMDLEVIFEELPKGIRPVALEARQVRKPLERAEEIRIPLR